MAFNMRGDNTYVPNGIGSGQKTVTTAGTDEQLTATSTAILSVSIKALSTNTGSVYVGVSGVSSTTGYILAAGGTISFELDNLNRIYLDVSVSGEGVSYFYVTKTL